MAKHDEHRQRGMKHKKVEHSVKGLGLHIIPFAEMEKLSIVERVKKILSLVLGNKIVILHGRLRAEEEARLIEDTMAMIDHVKNFQGIELAVIEPDMRGKSILLKAKHGIAKRLIGHSGAMTVIGPARAIKEIKKDPKKLELMIG